MKLADVRNLTEKFQRPLDNDIFEDIIFERLKLFFLIF